MRNLVFALLFVFVLNSVASAQSIPVSQSPVSGVLTTQSDGRWVTFIFTLKPGSESRLRLCVQMYGYAEGGHCTNEQVYRADDNVRPPTVSNGPTMQQSTMYLPIPTIPQYDGQFVSALELRGGRYEVIASLDLHSASNPGIINAAYEQEIAQASPFSSTKVGLKIVGSFNQNATVFIENIPIKVEVLSVTQSGGVKETTILLDQALTDTLPPSYRVTVNQNGIVQETVVKRLISVTGVGSKG